MYGSLTEMKYCLEIFRIHLRPMRRFYGAYLFSKSAIPIFKILLGFPFWRDDFWESVFKTLFNNDDDKCYKNSSVNKLVV